MKLKTILTSTLHTVSISTAVLVAMGLINPTFSAPPSRASVSVTVEGAGTVTSNPDGISCPTDCTQQYKTNTLVTFFATNNNESTFSGWGGACIEFGTASTCNVQVSGSVSITAQFTPAIRYPAPVPATGQTNCYDSTGIQINCTGTGQDGEYLPGVALPVPRFTNNGDGTVTDNLTGLIWLRQLDCGGYVTWDQALQLANQLGDGNCGLSDGSVTGDWRLPTIKELHSLVDVRFWDPALSNATGDVKWTNGDVFLVSNPTGIIEGSTCYWSSTTNQASPSFAWHIQFDMGRLGAGGDKDGSPYACPSAFWPVKKNP